MPPAIGFPSGHAKFRGDLWRVEPVQSTDLVPDLVRSGDDFGPLFPDVSGVHTPADVLTAAGTALALVFLVEPLVYSQKPWVFPALLVAMSTCALAFVLYVELAAFPPEMDQKNLAEGVKNAYSLLGALLGMILAYLLDEKKIHFPVQALWWAQILKVLLGLGLTMVLRTALKAPLLALTGGHSLAHGIRYFCMVLFAGALWPLTFGGLADWEEGSGHDRSVDHSGPVPAGYDWQLPGISHRLRPGA